MITVLLVIQLRILIMSAASSSTDGGVPPWGTASMNDDLFFVDHDEDITYSDKLYPSAGPFEKNTWRHCTLSQYMTIAEFATPGTTELYYASHQADGWRTDEYVGNMIGMRQELNVGQNPFACELWNKINEEVWHDEDTPCPLPLVVSLMKQPMKYAIVGDSGGIMFHKSNTKKFTPLMDLKKKCLWVHDDSTWEISLGATPGELADKVEIERESNKPDVMGCFCFFNGAVNSRTLKHTGEPEFLEARMIKLAEHVQKCGLVFLLPRRQCGDILLRPSLEHAG